jgi:hypothetical protein
MQVIRATQTVPYSRANVEILPDEEEIASQMDVAIGAVDEIDSRSELDMPRTMHAVSLAARAAAKASAQVRLF